MTDTLKVPPHGGQLRQIASLFNIEADRILDFSTNVNPDGPPSSVLKTLQTASLNPTSLTQYPDLEHCSLRQSINAHIHVARECISVANGFVPLLQAAIRARKIQRCLLPVPCFAEYRASLKLTGTRVTPFTLEPHAFQYNVDALMEAALDRAMHHDAILLANPQNPSGHLCPSSELIALVRRCAEHNITVLLDEAFIDYLPEHSVVTACATYNNLIVFRSVTKFFAMPALRTAYCISNCDTTAAIQTQLAPWPISSFAELATIAALADTRYQAQAKTINTTRRTELSHGLQHLGLEVYPASANFLLVHLPKRCNAKDVWSSLITRNQILTRLCSNFESLSPNHLRVAVRNEKDNQYLLEALRYQLNS